MCSTHLGRLASTLPCLALLAGVAAGVAESVTVVRPGENENLKTKMVEDRAGARQFNSGLRHEAVPCGKDKKMQSLGAREQYGGTWRSGAFLPSPVSLGSVVGFGGEQRLASEEEAESSNIADDCLISAMKTGLRCH